MKVIQAAREVASQDETLSKIAAQGPDIYCPFCGTRNLGNAKICSHCGGDLVQGLHRESGEVIGAYKPEPVKKIICQSCGAVNLETSLNCSNCGAPLKRPPEAGQPSIEVVSTARQPSSLMAIIVIVGIVFFYVFAIWLFSYLSSPRKALNANVGSVAWHTSVEILTASSQLKNGLFLQSHS